MKTEMEMMHSLKWIRCPLLKQKNKLDMALSMLNEMRTKDLVLDVFTYDSLFRSFKQRHDLVKTFWLMDQMKKEGCAPSDAIVRTLNWLVDERNSHAVQPRVLNFCFKR
ncbi:hypothetical protein SUGI_0191310 [Cryptomeria japonica]|nr:hypothetical protein SUGI_0191310 [Cryptomeria japonica]